MARVRGRAALLGAAVAVAVAVALGAVADAQVVVDPCAANKKKACLRLDTCEWAGKKGGGCRTPANVCSGIQKKKLGGVKKKKRCGDNPACRCSKKRKCGQCVANVGVGAPTPNDDERYVGICRGTAKGPDDKKLVCCGGVSPDSDCDNAFKVTGEKWQFVQGDGGEVAR